MCHQTHGVQPNTIQPSLDTKAEIKQQFQDCTIGFHFAVNRLMHLGFTEFAAEQYLYAE